MELEQYLAVVKRWWWLMVACVLVAAGSSYYGTTQMPRIYQATTTLMVGQVLEQADPGGQEFWIGEQLARTYAEMVGRRPVLESTAQALNLDFVPSAVSTRLVGGTQLLEISVRDTEPERARAVADEIAQQLILRSPAASADEERRAFVAAQLDDLQTKIVTTEDEIEDERERLAAANSARAIQQHQANINALEQKLAGYRGTYATMATGARGGTNVLTVIEPASTPRSPISPNVGQTVLLAAAIGLSLAVGGAFLIEYLDDTIKSPEDVLRVTDVPVLGAIARIPGDEYPEKLITAGVPRSPLAEAYRALRTNIQFSSVDRTARTVMVTSPNPVEGKSVTLANLAVVMAQGGYKVVVVDTDLRRPVQHRIFGSPANPGLSDAILAHNPVSLTRSTAGDAARSVKFVLSDDHAGDTPPSEAATMTHLKRTDVANLWLLPSGPLPPNPAELLGSERLGQVVSALAWADIILLDSPPVLAVTDAAVLGARVDGVVLVLEAGATRRDEAKQSLAELQRVGANVLGVVINQLSRGQDGYYYHNYYYRSESELEREREMEGRPGPLARVLQRLSGVPADDGSRPTASHE